MMGYEYPVLSIAVLCFGSSAMAQDTGEVYHAYFRTLGFKMRAIYACPIDKRKALGKFGSNATPDSKAFAQAFPKLRRNWMEEGAELFNTGAMAAGLTKVCEPID